MSPGIVAVHCGAGFHNAKYYKEYNKLSKQASEKGIEVLKNGGTALEAVRDAVIVLENHHRTNCGYGSNLTMQGQVENDASIMNGKTCSMEVVEQLKD
ncbi:hypothetical protein HHI36_013755 [Cryptolaemus montrouzieri]|uniref:Uncharacterized protein n=1 Tax=Cryptolaemus montrouzieri TaxID=559131 RepID=A0ABD2NIS9_9CUCU